MHLALLRVAKALQERQFEGVLIEQVAQVRSQPWQFPLLSREVPEGQVQVPMAWLKISPLAQVVQPVLVGLTQVAHEEWQLTQSPAALMTWLFGQMQAPFIKVAWPLHVVQPFGDPLLVRQVLQVMWQLEQIPMLLMVVRLELQVQTLF